MVPSQDSNLQSVNHKSVALPISPICSSVAVIGGQVNVESHVGFKGGLQHSQTAGCSTPYYATSTREVIYHVSTQLPADQLCKACD